MGICEDVSLELCDVIFVLFMIELSIGGLICLCSLIPVLLFREQPAAPAWTSEKREAERDRFYREYAQVQKAQEIQPTRREEGRQEEGMTPVDKQEYVHKEGYIAASYFAPPFQQHQQMYSTQLTHPLQHARN